MSSDATAANVLDLVGRVDRAATQVVSHWLADTEGFAGGEPQSLADLGALAGRVAPSVLVNAHLMWRGTAIEVLDASGADPALFEQARIVLADRCDAGLVAVSRQFDEPRDRLTGLANRPLLLERLGHALHAAARYEDSVGLIFIEVDLGSHSEDELLLEIADRALMALRQPYAIGGEEVHVSANAGIAVSSGGDGPETLLANASAARRAALEH